MQFSSSSIAEAPGAPRGPQHHRGQDSNLIWRRELYKALARIPAGASAADDVVVAAVAAAAIADAVAAAVDAVASLVAGIAVVVAAGVAADTSYLVICRVVELHSSRCGACCLRAEER